ncbi:SoxR reducing system RseC family protein [Microbulbifer sp. 2205BS26-8]|uniref:SoxR reducing system RseC family protein n=1 Tax=Microbulbifer sp. 2205BS26-8 TaxID=3064386 RepID=UPI00273EAEEB|nr:SoxR reducing system RseC family protein [Microbulbifer sp. 2205BS26-8]MDP5210590.1 SoxR reducing system RseC family protein [Microbulbifer sp. 2205BS26-8]
MRKADGVLEERSRIVAIESDAIWVVTYKRDACNGCAAKPGCGTGLLGEFFSSSARLRVALNGFRADRIALNDTAVIGIAGNALTSSALLVYLVPLVCLMLLALVGDVLFAEVGAVFGALAGLIGGALSVRWYSRRQRSNPVFTPVLLRIEPGGDHS